MPEWLRLPFVTVYGIFQPVLPAAFIEPTTLTWRITGIARALGWYLLWPVLVYAFIAAWKNEGTRERRSVDVDHTRLVVVDHSVCLARRRRPVGQSALSRYLIDLAGSRISLRLDSLPFTGRFLAGTNLAGRGDIPGCFHSVVPEPLFPDRGTNSLWVDGCYHYRKQPYRPGGRRVVGSS